jgi:hypothetical protein
MQNQSGDAKKENEASVWDNFYGKLAEIDVSNLP